MTARWSTECSSPSKWPISCTAVWKRGVESVVATEKGGHYLVKVHPRVGIQAPFLISIKMKTPVTGVESVRDDTIYNSLHRLLFSFALKHYFWSQGIGGCFLASEVWSDLYLENEMEKASAWLFRYLLFFHFWKSYNEVKKWKEIER